MSSILFIAKKRRQKEKNTSLCVLCLQEILSRKRNSLYTSIQNVIMTDLLWKNPTGQKVIQKSKVIKVQERSDVAER